MKAMVFAAGLGTRLKPLTDSVPKALVPVAGKPLLSHVLSKLRSAGVGEAVVNVHHFPDQIIDYLSAGDSGMDIKISDERDCLRETGGGLRFAGPLLLSGGSPWERRAERFLVHNVDILSNLDIPAFIGSAPSGSLSTIVVSERKTARYFLFDENMRLVGWTNVETGEVRSPYPGLDVSRCRKLAFAGIHYISEKIFDVFREKGEPERFPITDFYVRVCRDYPIYGYVPEGFRMMDVGKISTLSDADAFAAGI